METLSKAVVAKALTMYKNPDITMSAISKETGLSASTITRLAKKNKMKLRTAGRPATVQALLGNNKEALATRKLFAKVATTRGVAVAIEQTGVSETAARAFVSRLREGQDKFPGIKAIFNGAGHLLPANSPSFKVFAESERIQKQISSGKSLSAVASTYGVSPKTIQTALKTTARSRR